MQRQREAWTGERTAKRRTVVGGCPWAWHLGGLHSRGEVYLGVAPCRCLQSPLVPASLPRCQRPPPISPVAPCPLPPRQVVDFKGWLAVDAEEVRRGAAQAKPRDKLTSVEEMLQIAAAA